jgi:HSP20 family molecular chaperone IbpA
MMTTEKLTQHDLSITFDGSGRMWKFRPSNGVHGHQPVDARLTPRAIVLSVTVPGLQCGDVDLSATGEVLHVRGRSDETMHLAADVAMPRRVDLDVLETAYSHGVLEIRVPLIAPRKDESPIEHIAVAC